MSRPCNVCNNGSAPYYSFITVFKPELRQHHGKPAKHGIYHHISTTGAPVHSRFRRLNPQKLLAAKASFAEMERMGICSKASSPWASPLHMVYKSDVSWRPGGDYRRLNLITEHDHYPMPNIIDITNNIGKSRVFNKLDLQKGYFQVPDDPPDVSKTPIVTPFGNHVFHYSTFGLRNSGATFQRMKNSLFRHLPNVVVYIDDMHIFSEDILVHQREQHLRQVLSLLQQNGLIVRQDKC